MKAQLSSAVLSVILASAAFGRDKPPYQVGVFVQAVAVDSGTVSQRGTAGLFGGSNVTTKSIGHMNALVETPEGRYSIDPPFSMGKTILMGSTADPHKEWFMDAMHAGDKVLFSAQCNKHNHCVIEVPNPEKPEKVIQTMGLFMPNDAKSNAGVLCGTGKLTPEVEAQVCAKQ